MGLKTALISDCGLEVPMLWSEMPFAPLVDMVLFSSREGHCKPKAASWQGPRVAALSDLMDLVD
ncbi:MAG TPA: hypothetical protein EYG11_25070 [Candidatus Latescibacteria bacterium]|nr:hypothetical protein [Candidatus Handelsmanbacteria bacterium]HIL11972.1 hypothetical protein [Candidatus Latescibacterota bacterium]